MTVSISSSLIGLGRLLIEYALLWRVPEPEADSNFSQIRAQGAQIDECRRIIDQMILYNEHLDFHAREDVLSWGMKWNQFNIIVFGDLLRSANNGGQPLFTEMQIDCLVNLFHFVTEDAKYDLVSFHQFLWCLVDHISPEERAKKPSPQTKAGKEQKLNDDIVEFIENRKRTMPQNPFQEKDPRNKRYTLFLKLFRSKIERLNQLKQETTSGKIVQTKDQSEGESRYASLEKQYVSAKLKIAELEADTLGVQRRLQEAEERIERLENTKKSWLFGYATNPYTINIS